MIELHSRGDKEWATPEGTPDDRTVLVVFDPHFDTWCDEPHPMRFSKEEKQRFAAMSDFDKQRLSRENWDKYWALLHGKKGYLCPGNMEHTYGLWTVEIAGEWTDDSYDSFKQALGVVEQQTGETVKLVRRRKLKPEPTPEPAPWVLRDDLFILADELRGIEEALVRYDELMQSEDAPYVDQKLHEYHVKRKSELESLLTQQSV